MTPSSALPRRPASSTRAAGDAADSRALSFLVASTFFHFASLYFLLPTLPLYARQLGGSTWEVGLIIGILALTSLVARPFFGAGIDRAGRRGFLFAGAAIYVLASLGYAGIRSVPGLLVWRVFHGLGLAAFSTAAASLAADLAPPGRRGRTMGVFGLAQAAALTVGPSVGDFLLRAVGYRGLFLGAAASACASLLCGALLPAVPREDGASARSAGSVRAAVRDTRGPAAVQFAASLAYGTIIAFIAVVAQDRGLPAVGAFFALLALSSLAVRVTAGKAYDAWGPALVLAPLFLALSAGMGLLAVAGGPAPFLLAAVLAGLGIGGTHTTLMACVVDRTAPERRARGVAAFAACWELGVGGGTVVMGQVAQAAGFRAMFFLVALLPLLGLGALPALGGDGRVRTAAGEGAGVAAQPPK